MAAENRDISKTYMDELADGEKNSVRRLNVSQAGGVGVAVAVRLAAPMMEEDDLLRGVSPGDWLSEAFRQCR